jgi:hypothetical protein
MRRPRVQVMNLRGMGVCYAISEHLRQSAGCFKSFKPCAVGLEMVGIRTVAHHSPYALVQLRLR